MTTVVPFKARGVRAELQRALDERAPVRIHRERIQPGVIHGYVVGLSRDFCLIAEVGDAIRFDGYIAIAVADISALDADPAREFVDRALALRGETLKIPQDFGLADWAAIARSAAAARAADLGEHDRGRRRRDQLRRPARRCRCERGRAARARSECGVVSDTGAYEYEAIGSIGFGSGYLDALWQVAGAPGGPLSPRVPASDTVH